MFSAGLVIDNTLRLMHRKSDDDTTNILWRNLRKVYYSLCKKHSWELLRRKAELDFTTADSTGLWLPSNLLGIDKIWDEDNYVEFFPRDRHNIEYEEPGFRYYTYAGSTTPLATGNDASIASGDDGTTTFTADSLTADHTGEYIRFGEELAYFLLTAEKTFSPTYYGEDLTDIPYFIRPTETKKLVLVDRNENVLTDRQVQVYYWEAPAQLYRASDMLVLPLSKPVELALLREMPESKERRPVSEAEVERAVNEALAMNPDFPRDNRPRDRHNRLFDCRTSLFGKRATTLADRDSWFWNR